MSDSLPNLTQRVIATSKNTLQSLFGIQVREITEPLPPGIIGMAAHPNKPESAIWLREANPYEKKGYIPGATVRQYHSRAKATYTDAIIIRTYEKGGLDVEINGVKYGWSANHCEVISPPQPA